MAAINVEERISTIKKEMAELSGSLKVYTDLLEKGVKSIPVPEIIEIKPEPAWALPKGVKKCDCNL